MAKNPQKNAFEKKFGEAVFDLDYGKLLIIGLCLHCISGKLMEKTYPFNPLLSIAIAHR